METWDYRIVDVFTERPLAGNQLAVFEEATDIPEAMLQPLAKEIGFAETVGGGWFDGDLLRRAGRGGVIVCRMLQRRQKSPSPCAQGEGLG